MFSYEQILEQINLNCYINDASGFEMAVPSPIYWTKKYCGKKVLFSYRWAYVQSEDEECLKAERILSKLPRGISYVKNTVLTSPLPEEAGQYQTVYESYTTTYTITVSEAYSKKIVSQNKNANIVIAGVFDKKTLQEADRFKNRVLNSHKDILEPLFTQGLLRYGCVNNAGFTDYEHGFGFNAVGLMPLTSEAQRLGLVMALSDYGASRLKEEEFYYINRWNTDTIHISKQIRRPGNHALKDW